MMGPLPFLQAGQLALCPMELATRPSKIIPALPSMTVPPVEVFEPIPIPSILDSTCFTLMWRSYVSSHHARARLLGSVMRSQCWEPVTSSCVLIAIVEASLPRWRVVTQAPVLSAVGATHRIRCNIPPPRLSQVTGVDLRRVTGAPLRMHDPIIIPTDE